MYRYLSVGEGWFQKTQICFPAATRAGLTPGRDSNELGAISSLAVMWTAAAAAAAINQ